MPGGAISPPAPSAWGNGHVLEIVQLDLIQRLIDVLEAAFDFGKLFGIGLVLQALERGLLPLQ